MAINCDQLWSTFHLGKRLLRSFWRGFWTSLLSLTFCLYPCIYFIYTICQKRQYELCSELCNDLLTGVLQVHSWIELPFVESIATERTNRWANTVTLHLQEFSAVNVKGATLKGYARCRAVLFSLSNGVISDDDNNNVQSKCSATYLCLLG